MGKCCVCGKKIEGGHYNAPSGLYCVDCWEKKPPKLRKAEEKVALTAYGLMGRIIQK